MRRRTLLAGAGASVTLPLTGYAIATEGEGEKTEDKNELGNRSADGSQLSKEFECRDADRPEPAVAAGVEHEGTDGTIYESVGSVDYPAPPESFDTESVRSFVEAYERAYTQNSLVASHTEGLVGCNPWIPSSTVFDRDTPALVHVESTFSAQFFTGGGLAVTDVGVERVVYAVDPTAIIRLSEYQYEGEELWDEGRETVVRNGTLLECL